MRRRRGLVLGGLFFLASLYILTSFIWFIEITGNRAIAKEEIRGLIEQLGIRPGIRKKQLDLLELEQDIARMHSAISWAGCRIRGTLLEIEIVEHRLEPEPDLASADLVAAKDGLVERVLVIEGELWWRPGIPYRRGSTYPGCSGL